MDSDFAGGWNKEDGKQSRLVLSRTGYIITYVIFPIIWVIWLQTEIALGTMEAEYISLSKSMRDVLPFVSLTK